MTFQANESVVMYPLEKLVVYSTWGDEDTSELYLHDKDAIDFDQAQFDKGMKLAKRVQEKGMLFLAMTEDMEIELIRQCKKDRMLMLWCNHNRLPELLENNTVYFKGSLITGYEFWTETSVTLKWTIGENMVSIACSPLKNIHLILSLWFED